ncbi:flippase [Mucilaginibacter gynuensis]|uniref:Flippase n=1 Tax=Mucilaginibacter gynuensis TaxID=1302236 RepID=A0ABP8H3R0_9SPHI
MGIIQQQTIKSTIYSYLGVAIAFITTSLIQPHALSTEEVGLISILTTYSLLFAQFSILGFNGTARYFPYFRSEENKHHGYLFLACMVALAGVVLWVILAVIFKQELVSAGAEKSHLLEQYYWYFLPLTFFTLFFNVFDLYARMLYNTTSGTIYREFTKRVLILVAVLLVLFNIISFYWFMIIWLAANILPTVLMLNVLIRNNQFHFKPDFKFLDKTLSIKLISICFFAILTGSAPLIIQNLDTYFVHEKYGLSDTGIYNTAFLFASAIALPARSLYGITFTVVSEAWKSGDLATIKDVYKKSCVNQLIAALFLFIILWANIDNIFKLLPAEYASGKYVVFFVSLGYVIDASTGVNGVVLATSKYFKYDSIFNVMLIAVAVAGNIILIPYYGLTGAAIASALTFLVFNLFRYVFILIAFKMQPFTVQCLLTVITGTVIYYLSLWALPVMSNFIADTIIRTAFITILFGITVYKLHLSPDINILVNKYMVKLKLKK